MSDKTANQRIAKNTLFLYLKNIIERGTTEKIKSDETII